MQRTISKSIKLSGIGIHTGVKTTITLNPAPVNSGIRVKRTDLCTNNDFKSSWDNVCDPIGSTNLTNSINSIKTIEHLWAALYILQIDNIFIECNGPEIPIFDGSAKHFITEIEKVGTKKLSQKQNIIRITKKICVRDGNSYISIEPSTKLQISSTCETKNNNCNISQSLICSPSYSFFKNEIAPARTYGCIEDHSLLKTRGYGLGATIKNCIVFQKGKIINKDGLRFSNEFVRHKILDILGDLYVSNYFIIGKIKSKNTNHKINNKFLKLIFASHKETQYKQFNQIFPDCS